MGPATTSSTISIDKSTGAHYGGLNPKKPKGSKRFPWFDALIATGCLGGLTISTLYQVDVRARDFGASDFKTLYASVWSFTRNINAYSMANIQKVFVANGVVQPEKWFGHAPVYPWTTLALLSPLASMGMVPAAYVVIILSGALIALAVAALMRYAANNFDMSPLWRVLLAVLCASGPLLGFGINLGNVSVAASALCFLAFVWRNSESPRIRRGSRWIPAVALAAAFVLKPHLAFWVGVGMLLLPERAARKVVLRAGAVVAGFTVVTAGVMAAMGTLGLQTHAYLAMLASEASTGASMSATSRVVLPVVSQITSLDSIFGFWISNSLVRIPLAYTILFVLGLLTLRLTRRVNTERTALMAVGAWCALGLLATYHRTADAMVLLLLLPWVLDRVRHAPKAWHAWAAAALYWAMSASVAFPVVEHWIATLPAYSPMSFVLLRQAGLADCLLVLVLLLAMKYETESQLKCNPQFEEVVAPEMAA